MKRKILMILFSIIVTGSIVSLQLIENVNANVSNDVDEMENGLWKKVNHNDPPEFQGGSEQPSESFDQREMSTLQQLYPDSFFFEGSTYEDKIALTFNNGPDQMTAEILDVLNEYDVPATFFLLGSRAEAYPVLTTRIIDDGHVVGNQTFLPPELVDSSEPGVIMNEISRTEETLEPRINDQSKLVRLPLGYVQDALMEKLTDLDYSMIGWSVDALDLNGGSSAEITENILNEIHPGAIVLMPDGKGSEENQLETVKALRQIIPEIQKQGYEIVTVPELLPN